MANQPLSIDVRELVKLQSDLNLLSDADRNGIITNALFAGAETFAFEVRMRAPVDTGRLESNIFPAKVKKYQSGVFISGTNEAGTNSDLSMKKDDPRNAYYWRFVEYGTINQAPAPFIRTGFDFTVEKVTGVVKGIILRDLERHFSAAN